MQSHVVLAWLVALCPPSSCAVCCLVTWCTTKATVTVYGNAHCPQHYTTQPVSVTSQPEFVQVYVIEPSRVQSVVQVRPNPCPKHRQLQTFPPTGGGEESKGAAEEGAEA